ncbi:alpha-hydroxy acid oxidase [Pigmentiphaga soli]|uniref:Alpha-hydroxy acid oxidase n=2 Tax=Pigmentiphaga soli TaxID=1007095 RepID=A0ABP8GLW8_9BURK
MRSLDRLYNIDDFRKRAAEFLPKGIFEFIDRGAEDDEAIRNNVAAFRRLRLRPNVAVDASLLSTATTLFGVRLDLPLAIAPTGAAGLVSYGGELALARAAAEANIPFTLATRSMSSIEDMAKAGGVLWFQQYLWRERERSFELIDRVGAAGIQALIVTLDVPVQPIREFNKRNGFTFPFRRSLRSLADMGMHPRWLLSVIGRYYANGGMPSYESHPGIADNVTWADIREIRKRWPKTLMVKGVLRPEDALQAVACGCDGVVVSSHGGRTLDGTIATIDALPDIVAAVRGKATVIVDSGVRRGSDIVRALALGASAVMSGRPALYGLAAGGQAGVGKVLATFKQELATTMAQVGRQRVEQIGADVVAGGTA